MTLLRDEFIATLITEGKSPEEAEEIASGISTEEFVDTPEIIEESRQISSDGVKRFQMGKKFSRKNDRVEVSDNGVTYKLHGNAIAHDDGEHVHMTMAGWGTTTTRERLNQLSGYYLPHGVGFNQKKHEQHFNGKPISSRDIISVHKQTGEVTITPHDPQKGLPHITNFRLKPKTFDASKATQGNMFEDLDVPVNDLLMKFDNANRNVIGEGLVPALRSTLKSIKMADHKEVIMEEIETVLRNKQFTPFQKHIHISDILRDPWETIKHKK